MVIVEGRCTKLQLLISYIYNHWLTQKYSEFWLVRFNAGYCFYFLLPSYIYDDWGGGSSVWWWGHYYTDSHHSPLQPLPASHLEMTPALLQLHPHTVITTAWPGDHEDAGDAGDAGGEAGELAGGAAVCRGWSWDGQSWDQMSPAPVSSAPVLWCWAQDELGTSTRSPAPVSPLHSHLPQHTLINTLTDNNDHDRLHEKIILIKWNFIDTHKKCRSEVC